MFLWTCSGQVKHAIVVGTDHTACGLQIERLRVAEYDKGQLPCEICEDKVAQSRHRKIDASNEEQT